MRVHKFTVSLFLTTAIISATNLVVTHAVAAPAKVSCLCDCPDDHKIKPRHAMRPAHPRHIARAAGYNYGVAGSVGQHGWHSEWRQAPNDAVIDVPPNGYIPSPQAYGPPPGYDDDGVRVDNNGWSGGVGYGGDGGGGGGAGFTDGFGQVHFGNGGSVENGPTYNSYGQSFQYNPSQAGGFQPRLMGGFAPPASK